ncbi:hypothetical protein SEUCBS139899_006918 [Sporothrix eucalyptigena]
MEDTHPEGELPVVTAEAGPSSGSHSWLGSSATRSSHDSGQPNDMAPDAVHLMASKKTRTSSNSQGRAAIADAVAAGTTTIVAIGSPDGSESVSEDDDQNDQEDANEEPQFEDCPVDGCHESVIASEMAYHVDLHAALDYQNKPVDDSDVVSSDNAPETSSQRHLAATTASNTKANAKPATPTPVKKANGTPTRTRALSFDGMTSSKGARSSSVPPVQKPPYRPTSRKSTDSSRSVNAAKLSGNTETRKAPVPDDENSERHRERREHQRNRERGRGPSRTHTGELGMSTPGVQSNSHQTFLSRKPSKTIRSFLALFAGVDPRRHSSHAGHEGRDKEKEKANLHSGRRSRHSTSDKGSVPKAVAQVVSEAPKRLGKAELGKYADEERMPDSLAIYLKKEWGIVHQGGFCGYRNIQTIVSYIVGAEFPGHKSFSKKLPSVFDLQDLIEAAWDMGINDRGRIETGGIRLTRKYIGTPEAVAMFQSLNIPCSINAFKHKTPGKSKDLLLRDVEEYFSKGNYEAGQKVRATTLPPIYWQHPGHSLTIVGIEKTTSGETNLLVFDPIFRDSSIMARFVSHRHALPEVLLRPYRRGPRYLSRFRAFEILKLQPLAKDYDYGYMSPKTVSVPNLEP